MALVSSTPMLQKARDNGFCIAAFNIHTLEMMQAVVEAAEENEAPVILQTTVGTVKHLGIDYIAASAKVAAKKAKIPVALHLDHCQDYELILQCMRAGYTSVMIDASMYSFEENVKRTREVVKAAKALEVNVEAELGKIGGVEDEITVDEADAHLADPEDCRKFVELTEVDTLAPAIGTAHGLYQGEPRIDFDRIEEIARLVSIPLVLHGGSGIPVERVKRCVSLGIAKMNVATELRNAFSASIKQAFLENPGELDPRRYMKTAKEAVKRLAAEKMRICGSIGKGKSL